MTLHRVVLTQHEDEDDFTTEIWCPPGDTCPEGIWWECHEDGCEPTEAEEDEMEYTRHGRLHRYLDLGLWGVEPLPGSECGAHDESVEDDLIRIYRDKGPGAYTVDVSYWGDGLWEAHLVES